MDKFASAYARALLPARYASRGNESGAAGAGSLAPGALEIGMAAALYRAVVAIERLPDGAAKLLARLRAKPAPGAGATPVGCG